MSSQIYYDRQFVKIDEKRFIPITLDGSSNCYENTFRGMRRERNFNCNKYFAKNFVTTKEELEKIIDDMRANYLSHEGYSDDVFCSYVCTRLNGRGGSFNAFKSFYLGAIKTALTVEELGKFGVRVRLSVWDGDNQLKDLKIKDIGRTANSTEDLINLIEESNKLYANIKGYFSASIILDGANERTMKRIRRETRQTKQREKVSKTFDHYFVVKMEGYGFVYKCTRRGIKYSPYYTAVKKFFTQKEVLKRIEKLKKRTVLETFTAIRIDEEITTLV